MTVTIKLVLSAATFCFALGFAARHRDNPFHRRWMAVGIVLAWIALLLAVSAWILDIPIRPGYWLIDLLHGERPALLMTRFQQGLALLTFLLLPFQAWLGLQRRPLHGLMAGAVIPLWLVSYVSGMFFYF